MPKRLTTEEFIADAIKRHGSEKYCYSEVVYTNNKTKVKIYCNGCREYFWQLPHNHKYGSGCPCCSLRGHGANNKCSRKALTTEQFIKDCKNIHGSKYDYSETKYIRSNQKVKIFCNTCNTYFYQAPNPHKKGHGCPTCGNKLIGDKLRMAEDEFIRRSIKIHGGKYNYSEVNYTTVFNKVKIYCNTCQEYFLQSPVNHLEGKGHKTCCSNCFSPTNYGKAHKRSTVYILHFFGMDENFYKIGISSNSIKQRFKYLKDYEYEILYKKEMSGYDARTTEIHLHRIHKQYSYLPNVCFSGYTECFSNIDLNSVNNFINSKSFHTGE